MRRLRTLVVDDEPHARAGIRALLAGDPELRVVGEARGCEEAIAAMRDLRPDLVLLDVEMPDGTGFDALAALDPPELPIVVFVTAYDEYTLRAFDVSALDYLLKPFSDDRFARAMERAKARYRELGADALRERLRALLEEGDLRQRHQNTSPPPDEESAAPLRRLAVASGKEKRLIRVDEVDWIEAAQYCVNVHVGRQSYLVRGHLRSFERRLDPRHFARIHRSTIVNLDRVDRLRKWFRGASIAVLRDGTELRVSRAYRKKLEALLEGG